MSSPAEAATPVQLCFKMNGSCSRTLHPFGVQLTIYVVCAAGVLLTIMGNLLVVISIFHFKILHTPTNLLLLSLALADLLLGLTVLPFSTIRSVESCWYFGDDFCRLHTFLDTVFCLTSIFHLCFISVDRHCAICDPLLYPTKFTIRVACIYIALGWGVPVVYTSIFLYSKRIEEGLGQFLQDMPCIGSCQLLFNKLWGWINFPVFFFPCLIMIGLYIKIFIVATRQAKQISNMNKISRGSQHQTGVAKRERKAAKTLGIAVGIYLFCWLPFTVDTIIDSLLDFITPPVVFDVLIWFAYFNSACNPLIYVFSYRWFRKAVKLILTCQVFSTRTSTIDLYQEELSIVGRANMVGPI
ncbi:trace amine-associated receptor 5-like [Liasis olivaceus]